MRRGPLRAEILQIAAQLFLRGDRDALLQGGDVLLGQKPGVDSYRVTGVFSPVLNSASLPESSPSV